MKAAKRGKKFGQPRKIQDVPARVALLKRMHKQDRLLDEDGDLQMTAANLRDVLNAQAPDAPQIINAETVLRWVRKGCPGVVGKTE